MKRLGSAKPTSRLRPSGASSTDLAIDSGSEPTHGFNRPVAGAGLGHRKMPVHTFSCALWVVVIALMLAGCGLFGPKLEESAENLATSGMELYDREKYRDALESFQRLKDWYPFSKYAALAELKIADSHYHLEEYEEAVFAYEEFENLHPQNEAVPYVIYQIGRSYFDQLESIDRDQTATHKAIEQFQRLLQQYPDNSYAEKAREHLQASRENLAGHEFYIGRFYYKTGHYDGALRRLERVTTEYADTSWADEAQKFIELSQAKIEEREAKKKLY